MADEGLTVLEEILERSGEEVPDEILDLDAFLDRSPLFAALDQAARRELAAGARFRWVSEGEVLMREGSSGETFAVLKRGEVVVDAQYDGERRHLARLGPGSIIGEVAVLKGTPRTATVTAATDLELFEFPRDAVRPLFERFPALRAELEKLIESRSEETIEIFLGREVDE